MKLLIVSTILLKLSSIALAQNGGGNAKIFLTIGQYIQCEGKDAGHYTRIRTLTSNQNCDQQSVGTLDYYIIEQSSNGSRLVNNLEELAFTQTSQGANELIDVLALVTSGPLQGKYVYSRLLRRVIDYLTKCSSVLGQSVITSTSAEMLIADRLDLNVLISPNGAYEAFKKACTTVCKGVSMVV